MIFLVQQRVIGLTPKGESHTNEKGAGEHDKFVRVLEFCNFEDDYIDDSGVRYKGQLEIFVINAGSDSGNILSVFKGPLPLVDGLNRPKAHIIPLIFEHEPEFPLRGLAFAEQLIPQQKEINIGRSTIQTSSRRDARIYTTIEGLFEPSELEKIERGEDGTVLKIKKNDAQFANRAMVPVATPSISSNITTSMSLAESDLSRSTSLSQAALGQTTSASASEVTIVESHTQSEFGRHAEQRDIFLTQVIVLILASYTASLYDKGDSEGGDEGHTSEGEKIAVEVEVDETDSYDKNVPEERVAADTDEEADRFQDFVPSDNNEEVAIEREEKERERIMVDLVLLDKNQEEVSISVEDIDSDFKIGFNEAGRSPASRMQQRQTLIQLSDKLLQLLGMTENKALVQTAAINIYF